MMMTQAMVNLSFGRRLAGREGLFGEEDSLQAELGTRVSSWKKRGRERRAAPYLRKRAKRPRAPDNTTQFLMGDQGGARQSFSDSDLENLSESEDHFVEREFAKDYDNLKSEIQPSRQKLPKSKLIEELMTVEKEVKMLEKKYAEMTTEEQLRARLGTTEFDIGVVEPELAQKIQAFQAEIVKMAKENRSLRLDNTRLVNEKERRQKSNNPPLPPPPHPPLTAAATPTRNQVRNRRQRRRTRILWRAVLSWIAGWLGAWRG